jgi:hypothetical protein
MLEGKWTLIFKIVKYGMLAAMAVLGCVAMRAGGLGAGKIVSGSYVAAGVFMVAVPIIIVVIDVWFTEKDGGKG